MDSKINMGTLGISGTSLAMGLLHAHSLSSLTEDVELLKKSMAADSKPNNANLFADMEVDAATTSSPIDPEATPTQQIDAVVGGLESSLTVVSKLPNAIKNIGTSVATGSTNVSKLETKISETTHSIQSLIDVTPRVQSGMLQLKSFSNNAHVTDGGQFQAEDCNIGFWGNRGDRSALHFIGITSDKWAMYMADTNGKGPSKPSSDGTPSTGETPPSHAGVTGRAIRMRVGGQSGEGLIVENSDMKGLFSVGNNGRMTADATVVGDIDEDTVGISVVGKLTHERCALSQDRDGVTKANAVAGQQLQLCVGGTPNVWLDELGTMGVKNQTGTSDTFLNLKGGNVFVAAPNSSTRFRMGTSSVDVLKVVDSGTTVSNNMSINGIDLMTTLQGIESRLSAME